MKTYTAEQIAAQEKAATPWPEVEARIDAIKTDADEAAIVKLIEAERPWVPDPLGFVGFAAEGHGDLVPESSPE